MFHLSRKGYKEKHFVFQSTELTEFSGRVINQFKRSGHFVHSQLFKLRKGAFKLLAELQCYLGNMEPSTCHVDKINLSWP